jgi:uncharacterized protein YjbJ (UPF0337 family)
MSAADKVKNKIDQIAGQATEAVGRVTGDRDAEARGRGRQTKAHLKGAGEKIKDAFRPKR